MIVNVAYLVTKPIYLLIDVKSGKHNTLSSLRKWKEKHADGKQRSDGFPRGDMKREDGVTFNRYI